MAKYLDATGLTIVWDTIKNGFVQSVSVGSGLTNSGADSQHPVIGLSLHDYTFLSGLTSVTGNTSDRTYAVGIDNSGKLGVNVPWVPGDNKVPLVEISPTATTTIDPYKMYDLGMVSSTITIAFNSSDEVSGYCSEYSLKFVAGNNCLVLLPNGVKYNGGSAPTYVSGRTYEINICNGLVVVGEFY